MARRGCTGLHRQQGPCRRTGFTGGRVQLQRTGLWRKVLCRRARRLAIPGGRGLYVARHLHAALCQQPSRRVDGGLWRRHQPGVHGTVLRKASGGTHDAGAVCWPGLERSAHTRLCRKRRRRRAVGRVRQHAANLYNVGSARCARLRCRRPSGQGVRHRGLAPRVRRREAGIGTGV
ncbi:hypothetical protein D3C72_1645230 [compost metagenome]